MQAQPTNGKRPVGDWGEPSPPRAIDKDGRTALMVFRARMREGRDAMLAWLDANGKGPAGYAQVLLDCRNSVDQRVALGALKIEAQIREWMREDVVSGQNAPVVVISPEDMRKLLGDGDGRDQVVDALDVMIRGEPETNGHGGNGHSNGHGGA